MGIEEVIRVVPYDEQWPVLFQNEPITYPTYSNRLRKALNNDRQNR